MSSKSTLIILSAVITLGGILSYKMSRPVSEELTIGIIQTATHPALDQLRECFMEELGRLSDKKIAFVVQNAEGSVSQAHSIAENYHAHKKITAILAIGTPAVQAAARVEKEKPIFIAAVSAPESLGLSGSNICGTSDRIDTEAQADLLVKIMPSVQTVATIYNPGENNSQATIKKMAHSLEKRGIKNIQLGVHQESEITQTIATAARKSEVILIPADNLLVGAMPLVSREALKKQRPVFASDIPSVEKGALIAQGADYGDLGKATALIAYQVLLQEEKPATLSIMDPTNAKILVNERVAKELNIQLPDDLVITLVKEKGDANAA